MYKYRNIFQIVVFWVVTPCSFGHGYQSFGSACYLHGQGRIYLIKIYKIKSEQIN
jgi:hypothetical protein